MASQMQILMNPAKMRLGKGKAIKLEGKPASLVHIKGRYSYALCGAGKPSSYKSKKNRRKIVAVKGRYPVVTCYRCIKLYRMNQGQAEDQLLKFPSNKQIHHLIPGGREGSYVSKTKPLTKKRRAARKSEGFGPFTTSRSGAQTRGPSSHPTQTRMLTKRQKDARAKRAGGKQLKLIANPHYFGLGYAKGRKDFRSTSPTPASTLKQRSMSYQRGYLEGYSDAADKKAARANPKKRKNPTKRRSNSKALWSRNKWRIEWFDPKAKWRGFSVVGPRWSDHPTIYDDGSVGYDRPEVIPQYVKDAVYRLGQKHGLHLRPHYPAYNNPKKRKNTRTKKNPTTKRVSTQHGYRYMVNGKFATKRKYDLAKKRR